MTRFDSIGIRLEVGPHADPSTRNVPPLLYQVLHALKALRETGEAASIDLLALPLSESELAQLLAILGQGEVRATLDALGESRIWETRFGGVWVVDHYSEQQERIALQIEVTEIPELLRSQAEGIEAGMQLLEQELTASFPAQQEPLVRGKPDEEI